MNTHILGFPRIGRNRELKRALEHFWKGRSDETALLELARSIKKNNWLIQAEAGLNWITTGDFSLYDHVLDTLCMLGLVPDRFHGEQGKIDLTTYFHMARGDIERNVPAMEMTKWFDTNYHYIVPEFAGEPSVRLGSSRLLNDTKAVLALGLRPKPVLLGPLTLLCLGKQDRPGARWAWMAPLLEMYARVIAKLDPLCDWIQIDEPVLCTDLSPEARARALSAWARLAGAVSGSRLLLTTYFGPLAENLDLALESCFGGLHLDLVRGGEDLDPVLERLPESMSLSLGLVNGRNIWKTDLTEAAVLGRRVRDRLGPARVLMASSCSLLHAPVDLRSESDLPATLRAGMSFAVQKCHEVAVLGRSGLDIEASEELKANRADLASLRSDPLVCRATVRERTAAIDDTMLHRKQTYALRKPVQQAWLKLPPLPTTTIGSFPQTKSIRAQRKKWKKGLLDHEAYEAFLREEIGETIARQEALRLDVLVHGEAERNDMVEYFGERLDGFCFTQNGWVQSYGSRCVKPPVIFGDVARPQAMTVPWISYAQSRTDKPVKAMLTGPVTMLCWSFVREDLSRSEVCRQLALAIRDEVCDLEKAGIKIIQIDEAALREGMPLRHRDQESYLAWAVDAFRLTSAGVEDSTQIHTHMCYSEFNEIVEWIAKLDADVISIESSRSKMELLEAFRRFAYPNDVGPGVYDIHSPRIPTVDEIVALLKKALEVIPADRLWVNPDCGLKTRGWPEAVASLRNMVEATALLREEMIADPA
ncbi:5-methyltetrahydropteroyltriglutamate--homocysteine methyltransferase [Sulfidibacter corallicola]|uniref:5-methyltetrahydropteroyltriglutamate--homocysteine methyltransferase n=1 Tax=Sulfidibacter corallicola TaxID=2818388 RepID=A0A8A4TU60_SULCO|nr:5-methyltetrahydropteroyltriglutamate--homocysteine S-methyltransferase [Sulfidibacter corallicola]QTD53060.1 5-methyltetrahydropteroyltriglutamate--homocysteine S-methyltransferase [Sulfidibacter corallicola]